uniref:Uncharacterized protein n=1 Tax=Timema poppense TaxID=170557 RepID=A0A7R9CZG1_TIMPO|nr:unnamed protein product [Timema poppensis]
MELPWPRCHMFAWHNMNLFTRGGGRKKRFRERPGWQRHHGRPGQVGYRGTLARRLRFPNGVQNRATSRTGGVYINHLLSPLVAVSMTKPTEEDDGFCVY